MTGTQKMNEVIKIAKKHNMQIVLVGDRNQLLPIAAGNEFARMQDAGMGGVILGEAYRVPRTGAYDPRNPATWGQGGKAPLLRYEPGSGQSSGHGLNIGGAGSGKSTSSAIPTSLEWQGSLVCYDPAREIWSVTKRDRERRGREVYVLDPELFDLGCNVLSWIDVAPRAGAWIETQSHRAKNRRVFVAPIAGTLIETILR